MVPQAKIQATESGKDGGGTMKQTEYMQIPENLDIKYLVKRFGYDAYAHYQSRINDRMQYEGRIYRTPVKTMFLWMTEDKANCRGYYKPHSSEHNYKKKKNHGGT